MGKSGRTVAMALGVALLALGSCGALDTQRKHEAKRRVEAMLSLLKEGSGTSEAIAMCWWRAGNGNCEQTGEAAVAFDRWRKEKDVYRVESYLVGEVTLGGDSARVACDINGRAHTIVVQPGHELGWAN